MSAPMSTGIPPSLLTLSAFERAMLAMKHNRLTEDHLRAVPNETWLTTTDDPTSGEDSWVEHFLNQAQRTNNYESCLLRIRFFAERQLLDRLLPSRLGTYLVLLAPEAAIDDVPKGYKDLMDDFFDERSLVYPYFQKSIASIVFDRCFRLAGTSSYADTCISLINNTGGTMGRLFLQAIDERAVASRLAEQKVPAILNQFQTELLEGKRPVSLLGARSYGVPDLRKEMHTTPDELLGDAAWRDRYHALAYWLFKEAERLGRS